MCSEANYGLEAHLFWAQTDKKTHPQEQQNTHSLSRVLTQ